jgi:hypothetical protein
MLIMIFVRRTRMLICRFILIFIGICSFDLWRGCSDLRIG